MRALAAGRDVLAVMPTGYGKSAIYQVPALLLHRQAQAAHRRRVPADLPAGGPAGRPGGRPRPGPRRRRQLLAQPRGTGARLAIRGAGRRRVPVPRPGAAGQGQHGGPARGPQHRLVRGGRGPLRLHLGPRLPARLPSARRGPRAPGQPDDGGAHRHRRSPGPRGDPGPPADEGPAGPGPRLRPPQHRPGRASGTTRTRTSAARWSRQAAALVAELHGPGLVYAAKRKDTEKYAAKLARKGLRAAAYHAGRTPGGTGARCTGSSSPAGSTWWWRPPRSAWGSTSRMSGSCCTRTSPSRWTATTSRSAGPAATACPPGAVLHYRSEDLGLRRFFATHRPDEDALLAVLAVLRGAGGAVPPATLAAADGIPAAPAHRTAEPAPGHRRRHRVGGLRPARPGRRSRAAGGPRRRPCRGARARGQVPHRDDAQLRRDPPLPPPVPAGLLRRGPPRAVRELRQLHR